MRCLVLIFCFLILLGCKNQKKINQKDDFPKEVELVEKDRVFGEYNLIDIEKELNNKEGDYLLSLNNGNLSLCCHNLFDPLLNQAMAKDNGEVLLDSSLTLINGIRIGMCKTDFLDKFFKTSSDFSKVIKEVSVYEDERGDLYTKYFFKENRLKKIQFGVFEN